MSEPDDLNGAVANPFQARFGVAAGTQAPDVERQQWEQLCRELLQERDQLRAQLREMKWERDAALDLYSAKVMETVPATKEELLAQSFSSPSILEILEELERDPSIQSGQHTTPAPNK
jgi:hypothetical protein